MRPDIKTSILEAVKSYALLEENMRRHYGSVYSIKILKEINDRYRHLAIKRKFTRTDNLFGGLFLRVNSTGQISKLHSLNKLMKSWPLGALTITNMVYSYRIPPSLDISTVVTPGDYSKFDLDDFTRWCDSNLSQVDVIIGEESGPYVSVKAGPLGPAAILQAGPDVMALERNWIDTNSDNLRRSPLQVSDPILSSASDVLLSDSLLSNNNVLHSRLTGITNDLRSKSHEEMMKEFGCTNSEIDSKNQFPLARLAFLSAPAGKTRVVYILNYWAQWLLKPLHNAAFKLLECYTSDGTFDQEKLVNRIKNLTSSQRGEDLFSYDLKAATDRWPKVVQYPVMRAHFGKTWADIWLRWMSVDPVVMNSESHREKVSYAVGQPMGAYASWSALALSHHALVRYLASRLKVKATRFIIGDDCTLKGKPLSDSYLEALSQMGVSISASKSVIPDGSQNYAAEFAKHILLKGEDLTPFSPNSLHEIFGLHQWWKLVDLVDLLEKKVSHPIYKLSGDTVFVSRILESLLGYFDRNTQEKILILLTNPDRRCSDFRRLQLPVGTISCVRFNPWVIPGKDPSISNLLLLAVRGDLVSEELLVLATKLEELKSKTEQLSVSGIKLHGFFLCSRHHPIWGVLAQLTDALSTCYQTVANGEEPKGATQLSVDIDYLLELVTSGKPFNEWRSKKERKIRHDMKRALKVHGIYTGKIKPPEAEIWDDDY